MHNAGNWANIMSRGGITPSDSRTYSTSEIAAAFRTYFGYTVELSCTNYGGRTYYVEARPCYNKNSLNPENCNLKDARDYVDENGMLLAICSGSGLYFMATAPNLLDFNATDF
eukprot:Lithocolla_globosa_v1_NODE_8250_length_844_cov_3.267427.p1 type:complete len:113 gc:universal NODE_8250_length_844_cov_3.267427:363-701(+)